MKVLFILGSYLPEKTAGIENYTRLVARLLLRNDHKVEIAILNSPHFQPYIFERVRVIPLKNGAESFKDLLEEQHYDVCHFQEYSGANGIPIDWFTIAKQRCRKVFFTFHLPYLTCYKNDFRYKGITDCDNFSNIQRCVKCIVATRLSYEKSRSVSIRNVLIDLATSLIELTPKANTLQKNILLNRSILNELINTCDQVFTYASWFKEILEKNGNNAPSIKAIPYISEPRAFDQFSRDQTIKKKILFVGRIEQQKGLYLLCKAMNLISTKHIQLDVFGNVIDEKYFEHCITEFRFNFKKTLPFIELLQILQDYDFLILPSLFTEMYSMIAKNAFYEQLPVIASAAKGNVDMIEEGKNGFIFEYNNYRDLARVIDNAYKLKESGWTPQFDTNSSMEDDEREILSYYSI